MYEGVVRANATIRLLQLVSQTKPGEISHADSMSIMGEALFLRAHYHFELWRMWGNVPYYFAADTDFRKPNDTNAARGADSVARLTKPHQTPPRGPMQWANEAKAGEICPASG